MQPIPVQGGEFSQRPIHPQFHQQLATRVGQQQQGMRGYRQSEQTTISAPSPQMNPPRQNLVESNPIPPSSSSSNSSSRHAVPFPQQLQQQVMYAPLPFPPSEHPLPPPTNSNRPPQPHLVIPDYIPSRIAMSHASQPTPPSLQQPTMTFSPSPSQVPVPPYPAYQMAYSTPPQVQAHYQNYSLYPSLPQYAYAPQYHHGPPPPPPPPPMITPFPPIPLRHLEGGTTTFSHPSQSFPLQRPLAVLPPVTNQLPEIARGSIQHQNYFTPPNHSQAQLYPPPMYPPGIPLQQQQYQMRHSSISSSASHQSPSPSPRGGGGGGNLHLEEASLVSGSSEEYPISSSSPTHPQTRQIPLRLYSSEPILFDSSHPPKSGSNTATTTTQLPSPPASSSHSHSETTTLASPPRQPYDHVASSTSLDRPFPRAPSGITPALPPQSHSLDQDDSGIPTCEVPGCPFPRFCILSPCGDMICRDHLGSVIRGVQLLDSSEEVENEGEGGGEGKGKKKRRRVYECVKCHRRSEMVGPTREQRERFKRGSLNGVGVGIGLGLDLGQGEQGESRGGGEESFSIHYFTSGTRGSQGSIGWEGGGRRRTSSTASSSASAALYEQGIAAARRRESQISSSASASAIPEHRHEEEEDQTQTCRIGSYQPYPISSMGPSMLIPKPPSPPLPFLPPSQPQSIPVYPISNVEQQTTYYQTPYHEPVPEEGQAERSFSSTTREEQTTLPEEYLVEQRETRTPLATTAPVHFSPSLSPPPLSSLSPPSSPPTARSDISHLIPSEDPSIVQIVSDSPESPTESLTSQYAFRPTSSFFASYQFPPSPASSPSSTRGRGRGRGFARGTYRGRGGGFRRSSFAYSQFSVEEEEEGEELDENGERLIRERPSAISQVEAFKKRRELVKEELRGKFCVVKLENIPFGTTYRSILEWLPEGILPTSLECPQPIHLILHRATGRTLPHCYVEVKDEASAVLLLEEYDRSSLGDRTIRVKMERIGELMRDLFDQSKYFVHAPHLFNPASAPLPQLPQDGYALPSDRPILGEMDIQALSSWLGPPVQQPWSGAAGKPAERVYTNLASIIAKLPWKTRGDLWDENLRLQLFTLASRAIHQAQATRGYRYEEYKAIANRLIDTIVDCPGFTPAQRAQYSVFSPLDFPPLSPNSKLTVPRSNPTDYLDSPSSTVPRPPPSAAAASLDTSGSLPFVESGVSGWNAPPEGFAAAKEALLRPKSNEGGEGEQSSTLYWAEGPSPPLAQQDHKRKQVSHQHIPSVSIPRSSWADASNLTPTTPIRSSSPPPQSLQYPMTPPESPENVRPRYSSKEGWGSPYRGRGRGRGGGGGGGWKHWENPSHSSHRSSSSFSTNNLDWS